MGTLLKTLCIALVAAGLIVAGLFVAGTYFARNAADQAEAEVREQNQNENINKAPPIGYVPKKVEAPKYEITFATAGAMELSPSAVTATYGKKIKNLPVPEREGYDFLGWYTARLGGMEVGSGDKMQFTRDTELYARWEKTSVGTDRNVAGLPVLMYHQFYDPEQGEGQKAGLKANYMLAGDFADQMNFLSVQGFYFPSWDEVYAFVSGEIDLPEKSVVVTIDDGAKSFYKYAIPTLKRYKVPGTGFIIAKNLKKDMLEKYASVYVSFQSHTYDMHQSGAGGRGLFTTIDETLALEDVNKAAELLGTKDALAYPYGHHNERTEAVLEAAGIHMGFTTSYGEVRPGMNPYALPRVRINAGTSLSSFASQLGIKIDTAVTGTAVS
jgi:uncharacterized repeat protein (TIGR02543 family)